MQQHCALKVWLRVLCNVLIVAALGHKVGVLNLCFGLFLIAGLYFIKLVSCSSHIFALSIESGPFFKKLSLKAFCESGKMSQNLLIQFWGSVLVGLLWLVRGCSTSSSDALQSVFRLALVIGLSSSSMFFLLPAISATGLLFTFTTLRGSFPFLVFITVLGFVSAGLLTCSLEIFFSFFTVLAVGSLVQGFRSFTAVLSASLLPFCGWLSLDPPEIESVGGEVAVALLGSSVRSLVLDLGKSPPADLFSCLPFLHL